MPVRLADCRGLRKVIAGVIQGEALFVGAAWNAAGASVSAAEALQFQDGLKRVIRRHVAAVGRVYSGEYRMERAFAEKRDPVWERR